MRIKGTLKYVTRSVSYVYIIQCQGKIIQLVRDAEVSSIAIRLRSQRCQPIDHSNERIRRLHAARGLFIH